MLVINSFTKPFSYDREAVPGTTCANALAAVTAVGTPTTPTALGFGPAGSLYTTGNDVAQFYNSHRRVSIVSLGCGTNDYGGGRTAAATIADIQAWVAAIQANAPLSQIWVQTVPDRGSMSAAGGYTWKDTVNTAIRAISGITVVDVAANANLGCNGCATNTTYFHPDQVHFSGTNGVPPDANNNGITIQSGLAVTVMTGQGIQ